MSDILLIQPPQWYPVSPHLAVPILKGQLKNAGFDVRAYDLNVEFFNHLLTMEMAEKCDAKAREILAVSSEEYKNADISEIERNGSYDEKTHCLKYLPIKKFYEMTGLLPENDEFIGSMSYHTFDAMYARWLDWHTESKDECGVCSMYQEQIKKDKTEV